MFLTSLVAWLTLSSLSFCDDQMREHRDNPRRGAGDIARAPRTVLARASVITHRLFRTLPEKRPQEGG